MIKDPEAYEYYDEDTMGTYIHRIGQLARWAYEKGRQDGVNSFTTDNRYIRPKYKVGDAISTIRSKEKRRVSKIELRYALDGYGLVCWSEDELKLYKEQLKVGDLVTWGTKEYAYEVLCIDHDRVFVQECGDSNDIQMRNLCDLERVE